MTYWLAKKSFITKTVQLQWLKEPLCLVMQYPNYQHIESTSHVYNYNKDNNNLKIQESLTTLKKKKNIYKLIACTIDKVQSCDNFMISKIKDAWINM